MDDGIVNVGVHPRRQAQATLVGVDQALFFGVAIRKSM